MLVRPALDAIRYPKLEIGTVFIDRRIQGFEVGQLEFPRN